jgi:hypothetical protein
MNHRKTLGVALCALTLTAWAATASATSLGVGLHYLHNLGDIKGAGFEDDSMSMIGSIQSGGTIKFEADVEYIFNYLGTDHAMVEPSAWLLIGGLVYGGAGIGIGHTDGEWQDNPFYAFRGGVNFPLGSVGLDLFSTYRFQKDEHINDLTGESLDSLTFGAMLRFGL